MPTENNCNQGKFTRKRSCNFSINETFQLLRIWGSPRVQLQLRSMYRNFRVWKNISASLQVCGYNRAPMQCKNRVQNLFKMYKKAEKSKLEGKSFKFIYFRAIKNVLTITRNDTTTSRVQRSSSSAVTTTNANGPASNDDLSPEAFSEHFDRLIDSTLIEMYSKENSEDDVKSFLVTVANHPPQTREMIYYLLVERQGMVELLHDKVSILVNKMADQVKRG